MSDSIEHIFPLSPAAGTRRRGDRAVADDAPVATAPHPDPALALDRALERRLVQYRAANDDAVKEALERDRRDVEALAIIIGTLTLLLGIFALVVL